MKHLVSQDWIYSIYKKNLYSLIKSLLLKSSVGTWIDFFFNMRVSKFTTLDNNASEVDEKKRTEYVSLTLLHHYWEKERKKEKKVLPRFELGLLDSESNVLTARP